MENIVLIAECVFCWRTIKKLVQKPMEIIWNMDRQTSGRYKPLNIDFVGVFQLVMFTAKTRFS